MLLAFLAIALRVYSIAIAAKSRVERMILDREVGDG
jgi:hypothetical protein